MSHADLLLRHRAFSDGHRPEVVLQLGEPPASKVQGQWLLAGGADLVVVDPDGAWFDPGRQAELVVAADPDLLCRGVTDAVRAADGGVDDSWLDSWAAADAAASTAVATTLASYHEPIEPAVARDLVAALPDGAALVVSSSMPIRDVEWFTDARRGLRVLSNRGANGIDGVVSTAVGVALTGTPTALLIGDVALLHDANGLLGLAERDVDLTIVVVDNDGGGIFSFLPQADQLAYERFELLFGTPHGVDLRVLAQAHGIRAMTVGRQADLGPSVSRSHAAGGVNLLVVNTLRELNVAVHDELNAAVGDALDR